MQQNLQKLLIIDSSSLIAFERVDLLETLKKLGVSLIVPEAVSNEVGIKVIEQSNIKIEKLRGKSFDVYRRLIEKGVGKGEAECLALSNMLDAKFILCDDAKFIRQKYFIRESIIEKTEIFGFSFILHLLIKRNLLNKNDLWKTFDNIIKENNWKGSVIEVSNYVFLKDLGY